MSSKVKKILGAALVMPLMVATVIATVTPAGAITSDAVSPAEKAQEGTCVSAGGTEYKRPVRDAEGNITTEAQCIVNGEDIWGTTMGNADRLIGTIINILLYIIGILCVVFIIWGGISYTMSRGDSKKVESAKNTILYAVVGLVIALIAYALVNWVFNLLG